MHRTTPGETLNHDGKRPIQHRTCGECRGKHGAVRKNRGIRFSDAEWETVQRAAKARGLTPGEFVRETIRGIARGSQGRDPDAVLRSLASLIERTFRYTWMLATRMGEEMTDAGEREALDRLVEEARKLQDELLDEGSQ